MGPRHFHGAGKISKSRQNKLYDKRSQGILTGQGTTFALASPPGRWLRRAPAVRRSAAGAFMMRVEVRGHSPFMEYLKPLWVPLVRRESDPPPRLTAN